eukprot:gene27186-2428_t
MQSSLQLRNCTRLLASHQLSYKSMLTRGPWQGKGAAQAAAHLAHLPFSKSSSSWHGMGSGQAHHQPTPRPQSRRHASNSQEGSSSTSSSSLDGTYHELHLSRAEFISSASNDTVKRVAKLRTSSKYRTESRRFLLIGTELITEAADAGSRGGLDVRVLYISEGYSLVSQLRFHNVRAERLVEVSKAVMKKLSGLDNVDSVGAVAELDLPEPANFIYDAPSQGEDSRATTRLLALEGVQDPGNMGTLLRSALAFGWDGVFLLPGCCSPYGDKAVSPSDKLASTTTTDVFPAGGSRKGVCLVLGSEGQGLSEMVARECEAVAIPMVGEMESLNVGIAGGVLMLTLSSGMPGLVQRLQKVLRDD